VIATLIMSVVETTFTLPCHLAHENNLAISFLGWLLRPFRFLANFLTSINLWTERAMVHFVDHHYTPLIERLLNLPAVAIAISVTTLMVTVGIVQASIVPWVIIPKLDSPLIQAKIAFPDGTPVSVTDAATRRLETAINKVNERYAHAGEPVLKLTHRHVGQVTGISSGGPEAPTTGSHVGFVEAELFPASERSITSDKILAAWREESGEFPGTEMLTFGVPNFGPGGTPIEFKLLAPAEKMAQLEAAVEECKVALADKRGVFDVADDSRPGKWEFQIQVKEKAMAMGVTAADLAETVRASYYGEEVMRLQRGRHEVKLMVRYPRSQRRSLADFENIRIRTNDGAERPLTELAEVKVERGYAEINRLDKLRSITISSDIDESQGVAADVVAELQRDFMPHLQAKFPDVRVRWEGQQEQTNESMRSPLAGYMVALLAMYVVLTLEFRSYLQPFLVMAVIPFGFVGAVWGHALLSLPLTLFSVFGLVALTGVMVNDSIVLIDFINNRIKSGATLREAVMGAGRQRLRPIFLNSVTTIIGLVPLLLDRSFQAQAIIPMAVSMAFGQMLSTVIVLLLMPTFYYSCARISGVKE
jgi:multidrug efflux pump subunit AcrB